MPSEKWIDFILETEFFYGIIYDYATWLDVVRKHGDDIERLFNCRTLDKKERTYPYFGEGPYFKEELVLGEWAKLKGMNLNIKKEKEDEFKIPMDKIHDSHQQSSHAG